MTDGYQKSVQALIKKIQVVAFIIAAIIVGVVVFSSISKEKIPEGQIRGQEEQLQEEQLEEQISVEEQLEEQPEEQAEEVSPSVKIESATAIPTRCYKGIQGESTGCECTVEISGTATLPVTEGEAGVWYGDSFPLSILDEDPLTCKRYSWATVVGSITCPNWYSDGTSKCIRTRDQSATGKWSITFTNRFDPNGSESYFAVVYSDLRWEPIGVWDSVTLTCQP